MRIVSIQNVEKLKLWAADTMQKQQFSQSQIVQPTFEWLSTKVFNVVPMVPAAMKGSGAYWKEE